MYNPTAPVLAKVQKGKMKDTISKALSCLLLQLTMMILPVSNYAESGPTGVQQQRRAVVNLSSIYMRARPDYESALETQELMGSVVTIVGEESYWREIVSDQPYKAWCTEKSLVEMTEKQIEDYIAAPKIIVIASHSQLLSSPRSDSQMITDLVCGDILRYAGNTRTVKRQYLKLMLPSGVTGWVRTKDVADYAVWAAASDDSPENIISTAMRFVGVPYLWGGMTSKGFDCSGLIRISYLMNGIILPRNASQQIFCGEEVPICLEYDEYEKNIAASLPNLFPGDLLFFGRMLDGQKKITHVGLYIGDGKMIHSSHLVRVNSLLPSAPDYYENAWKLIGACRIIGHEHKGSNGYTPRVCKEMLY